MDSIIMLEGVLSFVAIRVFLTLLVLAIVLFIVDFSIDPDTRHSNLPDAWQTIGGLLVVGMGLSLILWAIFKVWGL